MHNTYKRREEFRDFVNELDPQMRMLLFHIGYSLRGLNESSIKDFAVSLDIKHKDFNDFFKELLTKSYRAHSKLKYGKY